MDPYNQFRSREKTCGLVLFNRCSSSFSLWYKDQICIVALMFFVGFFLFDSWMVLLHNRLYENRIAPPTTGSCELFLASSHRDSRIHAGEREDWSCLYTITEEEEKSINHCWKIGGFCAVQEALEYGPWKYFFHCGHLITAEHWAAATGSLPGPGGCPGSHLYILPSYLSHYPTAQGLCMFGSSFLLPQLGWVCALEGVRRKSSSSRVLKTSLGLIAEALKGRELHVLQLWVYFMVF